MLLDQKKLLLDIQVATNSITEYLGENPDFTVFQSSKMLRRAVNGSLKLSEKLLINCSN